MATRRVDYLTGPAIQGYLARGDAAILAVGPTETHGLHLPLGCDYLISLATAELAAREADALVLPPFAYSWPGATAKLPGTMRLAPDLVQQVLVGILEGAIAQGFRRLAMVCAHGPDVHTATIVGRHVFERTGRPVAVHHASPGRGTTARERELGEAALQKDGENAGFGETSRLMAALEILRLPAALVDVEAIRRGPARGSPLPAALTEPMRAGGAGFFYTELSQHIPTPSGYSVEEGHAYLEAAAAAIAASLAAMRELDVGTDAAPAP
jgi:creatinine amidohydrolase/Fe(II)-dependent formamide hydrolase-like protein